MIGVIVAVSVIAAGRESPRASSLTKAPSKPSTPSTLSLPSTAAVATTPATPNTTVTSTTVTTPVRLTALARLQPHDVDRTKDCSHNQSPPTGLVGVTDALTCSPRNLPGGQLFSFQFDNAADFVTSLAALNRFKGFDPPTAGSVCPPGSNPQGTIGWHSNAFPFRLGQVLECLSVGDSNSEPDYIWAYPSENIIMDAQAAPNSTFTALNNWWTSDTAPR